MKGNFNQQHYKSNNNSSQQYSSSKITVNHADTDKATPSAYAGRLFGVQQVDFAFLNAALLNFPEPKTRRCSSISIFP